MRQKGPSREELQLAATKTVSDILAPGLQVLFCGINPGLYTAWVGHHFGRPGNRFWKALYLGGFTPRLFHPSEQDQLLQLGYGMTNIVPRATATAAELSVKEQLQGGRILEKKVLHYQPDWVAILGIQAYRVAFQEPDAQIGEQPRKIGSTKIWVLPNPSGLNAHYTQERLGEVFAELCRAVTLPLR